MLTWLLPLDLVDIITFNPGLSKRQALASAKTLANALEAVLGAIYIDSGNELGAVKAALDTLGIPTTPADLDGFQAPRRAPLLGTQDHSHQRPRFSFPSRSLSGSYVGD
ncbi:hypothetical protein LTR95_015335 [Oleoguttula sp. CCFEE 5521]